MKRLALLPVLTLALVACDDKEKEALNRACPIPAPAMKNVPTLPGHFPSAPGITYTGVKKDGPTTVASGYLKEKIGPAHDAYVQTVGSASSYSVTKEEQEEADAEVNFAGAGVSGQVKLLQTCRDRTNVTITIRPA